PEAADADAAYAAYCKVLLGAAKKTIPCGYNRNYIPGWDEECSRLLCDHQRAISREEVARLDVTRRTRWTEVVESIDFTHSSRKAWQTINQLTDRNTTPPRCPVTADAIASQLLKNGRFPDADKDLARLTSCEVSSILGADSVDSNLSGDFTADEISEAISKLKPGKSPGRDNIHPEFVIHQSSTTSGWLCAVFSSCYQKSKLPKTWRRAIALPKPNKPAEDPKSYRPISLLCGAMSVRDLFRDHKSKPEIMSAIDNFQLTTNTMARRLSALSVNAMGQLEKDMVRCKWFLHTVRRVGGWERHSSVAVSIRM
ncbi:hypothetical protein KUCAC02_016129, partial [Chaenocephalus aceratus]